MQDRKRRLLDKDPKGLLLRKQKVDQKKRSSCTVRTIGQKHRLKTKAWGASGFKRTLTLMGFSAAARVKSVLFSNYSLNEAGPKDLECQKRSIALESGRTKRDIKHSLMKRIGSILWGRHGR